MAKRDNPRLKLREFDKEKSRGSSATRLDKRAGTAGDGRGKQGGPGKGGAGFGFGKNADKRKGSAKSRPEEKRAGFFGPHSENKRTAVPYDKAKEAENTGLVIGRNPVMEAIKSGRTINKIEMQKDGEGSIKKIASLARERGIQIQYVEKAALDRLVPGRPHQGIAAFMASHDYADLEDILAAAEAKGEAPLLIILDGLEDPHNLGAILRSADGAGAHGVVIPSRRAVALNETVAKASAGAIEYVPVARVVNLARTIDELKEKGLWIASVDMDGTPYSGAALDGPLALVIGGEGGGVSRLVKEKSDFVISIPMKGRVNSLNASNAAAIVLYEAARQRDANR
ncbi:MAG TPA: 23S rRNA (guanosine(2251)-2'-O)-methyltransferase RlmB [Bacillota bacterium]|nr:23S rRNA (guanosine(2251)-2'-O)-methyltransferase RlmB [Bacillota bacterium]